MGKNDEPRTDHGIQVLYEFCLDAGSMERSRYFGFSKDLYHMDHFMGGFRAFYPTLFTLVDYDVLSAAEDGDTARVEVNVRSKAPQDGGAEVTAVIFPSTVTTPAHPARARLLMT